MAKLTRDKLKIGLALLILSVCVLTLERLYYLYFITEMFGPGVFLRAPLPGWPSVYSHYFFRSYGGALIAAFIVCALGGLVFLRRGELEADQRIEERIEKRIRELENRRSELETANRESNG